MRLRLIAPYASSGALNNAQIVRMLMSIEVLTSRRRASMRRVVGVDVGGTFTDLLLYEVGPQGTHVRLAKILTTAANQADGVLAAIAKPAPPRAISTSSSTARPPPPTPCSSARWQRSGSSPRAASATRSSSAAARGRRPYGMTGTFEPLIPRERRLEVDERMNVAGEVVTPLDEARSRPRSPRLARHGLREPRHPLPALLRQSRARAARRRDRARALAERLRHARPPAAVGVPRVRARHHGLGERRRAADPRPLRAAAAGRARGAGLSGATCWS